MPDSTGSYTNGTWLTAGNLPAGYNPLYFASQVLPSGAVVVMGGEYNACNAVWTTLGAVYSPWTNKWSPVDAPAGWTSIGDAQSIILPNGKMMLANCCTTDEAILTLTTVRELGAHRHRQGRRERRRRLDDAAQRQHPHRRRLRERRLLRQGIPDLYPHNRRMDHTIGDDGCEPRRSRFR